MYAGFMQKFNIPGYGVLAIEHLVLDYNGTLALDGEPLPGVTERLARLAERFAVHVLTADTFGGVGEKLKGLKAGVRVLGKDRQDQAKLRHLRDLGPGSCCAIGNGRNDALMLKEAALGIAVVQEEGAFANTLLAADIICPNINLALDLLLNPLRLTATLRS